MNAINYSATRTKTFLRGINQGINLGDIKRSVSTTSTVSTPSSISMVVLILLTLGFLTGMAFTPCGPREAYHSFRQARVHRRLSFAPSAPPLRPGPERLPLGSRSSGTAQHSTDALNLRCATVEQHPNSASNTGLSQR
jgi:hypothetical protein